MCVCVCVPVLICVCECVGRHKRMAAYHEKQDGSLCAQHALNNLLQGRYFTPVDLADIARYSVRIGGSYLAMATV